MSEQVSNPLMSKPLASSRSIRWDLVISLIPLGIGLLLLAGIAIFLSRRPDLHPDLFFEDVTIFATRSEPYLGMMSNLGSLLWISSASFLGIGALVGAHLNNFDRRFARYLGVLAVFVAFLGVDDLLLFHERAFRIYLHIPEDFTLGAYFVIMGIVVVYFFKQIRAHEFRFFLLFAALFIFSEIVDVLRPPAVVLTAPPILEFLEEGPKFLALVTLWTYSIRVSYYALKEALQKQGS